MRRPVLFTLLFSFAAVVGGCAGPDKRAAPEPATPVDLSRYMGAWHVIANIPYFAERGKVATRDEYTMRADGRIDNVFVYRKEFNAPEKRMHAIARVLPDPDNTRWKIRFFGVINTDYLILDHDADYRWALIGHPSRKYAWIFARDPRMDAAMYAQLLDRLVDFGYERNALLRVPQFPDQQGTPGFQ